MSIDNSNLDLAKAGNIGKYKKLILADARNMPFKNNSFQTVISISVIEHIPKTDQVLKEVNRVLIKQGMFIFTTPRKDFTKLLFFPRLLRILHLNLLARYYENAINKIFKHFSLYSESEWKKLLTKNRFRVEKIEANIGESVAILWDLGLIFALPSQISKFIFGKRLVLRWKFRIDILNKIFSKFILNNNGKPCNFLIIARKY